MIRMLLRVALGLGAMILLLDAASGQPPVADKYIIRDKTGATKNFEGIAKMAATGYQLLSPEGKLVTTFQPGDVVRVIPGDLVGVDRPKMLTQHSNEDKKTRKDNETARLGYTEMLKEAASAPPKTKQYLTFRKTVLSNRILDESDDDEWSKHVDGVIKEWSDYLNEFKTGWEVWIAARSYARLNIELDKYREVESNWRRMGAKEVELPADLRMEATIQLIDAQIRGRGTGFAAAAKTAETELKTAQGVVAKGKLEIYARAGLVGENPSDDVLNAAVKDINDKIAATNEPTVRAVGFSMIGELYMTAKKPRDAMWAFLWVETVYKQDKDEVLKALVRLKQCFKEQMDDDREKAYIDKIRHFRQQLGG